MMDTEMARKFGQMESRLDALEQDIDDIKAQNLRMELKLDMVVERLATQSGGTKMLVTLLTLSATVGAVLTKVWEMILR